MTVLFKSIENFVHLSQLKDMLIVFHSFKKIIIYTKRVFSYFHFLFWWTLCVFDSCNENL